MIILKFVNNNNNNSHLGPKKKRDDVQSPTGIATFV